MLIIRAQTRAGANEAHVVALQQTRCLGIQPQAAPFAIQRVDALEQFGVEKNLVPMGSQLRRDCFVDGLQGLGTVGPDQVVEHRLNPIQRPPAFLQRNNGVVEGRGLRLAGDGVDLLERLLHADLEGRHEMVRLDSVERRILVRQRTGLQEWIAGGFHDGKRMIRAGR